MQPSDKIVTIENPKKEAFLRARTLPFIFEEKGKLRVGDTEFTLKEMNSLLGKMKKTMREANGVGLSANQIGLNYQLFVASVHTSQGEPKFYAVFNPSIEKSGDETVTIEEGCLSVPDTYGDVPRARSVVLRGFDKHGKPLRMKAWDLLARVFQHEVDHLNGKLFLDRTKQIRHMQPNA